MVLADTQRVLLVSLLPCAGPASDIFVTPALAIQVLTLLPIAFTCKDGGRELPEISKWRMIDSNTEDSDKSDLENDYLQDDKNTLALDRALRHSIHHSTKDVISSTKSEDMPPVVGLHRTAKEAMQDKKW